MPTAPAPALSIIVVSFNAAAALARCLESLSAPAARCGAETLIVRGEVPADAQWTAVRERYRNVRWIPCGAGETIPRLRLAGIRAARAPIVALLEDDCVIDEAWCDQVLAAHEGPWVAVGGAVEPGPYRRARDWAVYFYEYGRFMLPFEPHPSADLPGNNVTYKRSALDGLSVGQDGFYDTFVHRTWEHEGRPMLITPTLVVRNENFWPLEHFLGVPFHHGRGFAAKRAADWPVGRRLLLAMLAPALPVVQAYRLTRLTLRRGRLVGCLAVAIPALAVFGASWGIGESVGYLMGPGKSLARWR